MREASSLVSRRWEVSRTDRVTTVSDVRECP